MWHWPKLVRDRAFRRNNCWRSSPAWYRFLMTMPAPEKRSQGDAKPSLLASDRTDLLTIAELQNILRGGATKPLVEEDDAELAPIPKPATHYDDSPEEV